MITGFALWLRFLFFPLFARVSLDPRWLGRIKEEQERGPVVHVVEVQGLLDLALLNYLFVRQGIVLPPLSNTRIGRYLRPVLLLLLYPVLALARLFRPRDLLADFRAGIARGESGFIFLKRARFVMVPRGNIGADYLQAMVEQQRAGGKPLTVIPHVIFWTKGPEKYKKSAVELLLGDPNAPGLRKLLTFLSRPARTHVTCGEPVAVASALTGEDDEQAARRLSWLIHRSIDAVEKVTRGPMLKSALQFRNEMMANPDFTSRVEQVGAEMKLPGRVARRRAISNLQEIAADFRISYIEGLSFVLTPIFKRLFSSFVVDRDAVETIREAAKDSAVILVPCHRSHIDYLVISYLMYLLGVNPPHIAAGANLTFFPMGHIFRHCGAFFIRRKIGGDKLYAFVLAQYVRKLLKEGHSIEFFIEGGRSRTGKTLMPKFGLLNYVAEAVMSEAVQNVKIVPIALSYEQIVEVEGYARELSGGDKRKEDLTGLVKSAEVLDSRYGRLYLTAGRPINVVDFFRKSAGKEPAALNDDERRLLVKRLGYLVLGRINRATVVNPTGLVATALLSHHRRGIAYDRFLETAGFLLNFAAARGYPLSLTLERALRARAHDLSRSREEHAGDLRQLDLARGRAIAPVLDEAIDRFAKQRHLAREWFDDGDQVLQVRPQSRINLNYYRNNIIHVFQREALVALAIFGRRNDRTVPLAAVEEDVRFLSRLLRQEFIFRIGDFHQGIVAGVTALQREAIVEVTEDSMVELVAANIDRLAIFRNMVLPIVESYLVAARHALLVRFKGALRLKELTREIIERARKDYGEGGITCQESLSTASVTNALEHYLSLGILKHVESGIDAGKVRFSMGSSLEQLEEIAARLERFVDVE